MGVIVHAHPGIGIVTDSKGNIYYTDLSNVYQIDKDGISNIVVSDVHTHELYMDADDNLYGEHMWYEGERIDKWGYYLWCLRPDGELIRIQDKTEGFRTDYSYVRDTVGNMYWVDRGDTCLFYKKDTAGVNQIHAKGVFRDVRWMYSTPEGKVYFIDLDALYSISPDGKINLVADDLAEHGSLFSLMGNRHNIFGIWEDAQKNIYLAVYGGRCVKRISPDGNVSIVAVSEGNWAPTGGVFDKKGQLWLLEYSTTNQARVRKAEVENTSNAGLRLNNFFNIIIPLLSLVLGTGSVIYFIIWFRRKRKINSNRLDIP